eukprot:402634_1
MARRSRETNPAVMGVICFIVGVIMIIWGINNAVEASRWKKEMTQETCLITNQIVNDCSYSCHCSTHDGHRSCSTCWGLEYDYDAKVKGKCDNETISTLTTSDCDPSKIYIVDREYTCYVLDCHKAGFIFTSPSELLGWGYALIVFGALVFCVPCLVLLYVFGSQIDICNLFDTGIDHSPFIKPSLQRTNTALLF